MGMLNSQLLGISICKQYPVYINWYLELNNELLYLKRLCEIVINLEKNYVRYQNRILKCLLEKPISSKTY